MKKKVWWINPWVPKLTVFINTTVQRIPRFGNWERIMTRMKRIVHNKSHCTELWTQYSEPICPVGSFSFLLPPVVHSTHHLFANSWLFAVDTSLVAVTQVLITVLHGFTSTFLTHTSQFHSRGHPFVVSFNSTVTMPHTRIVASPQLTLLRLVTCLICHVSQCSNNLLFPAASF